MNALVNLAKVFKFHGGVHPPENKAQSTQLPIGHLDIPKTLTLPLRQHVGNLPKLSVNVGDYVLKGQLLAEAEGTVSAAIHAPTSGTISAIGDAVIPHPSGLPDTCITLNSDGLDTWIDHAPTPWRNADRASLIASLRKSGIVGLGGATFPTHIKLRTDGKHQVHTLIINAAECEPYITCDDMLMRERAAEIIQGIEIAQFLLGAEHVMIGVEDNKPVAIAAMQAAATGSAIQVHVVPTLYPSGDARRLVYLLLGKEIAHNKRATEEGVQVFNVATTLALHRYFNHGEPSLSRVVSMTGNVQRPQNFEVLVGTPLMDLVAAAGGEKADTTHFIMGGPMMGFNLPSTNIPITKATNCIIAVSPALFAPPPPAMPCIRCARCADACPVSLQPQELYWFAKSDNFEKANDYKLFDCIECGACAYVCPSDIPLVQYYRYAKSEIIADNKAKEAANLARERNEARLARIEREKQERAQKHAERAQAGKADTTKAEAPDLTANTSASPSTTQTDEAKKAAIAAAIERAKSQKANTPKQDTPPATSVQPATDDAKKAAIAAAIERAKAQKAAAIASGEAPKNIEPESKKIQQEIQEIDARRAAVGLVDSQISSEPDSEKQAKIAAAIAKAKAAKAAALAASGTADNQNAQLEPQKTMTATQVTTEMMVDDEKQAKIAAAIAKAKAAKAAALAEKEAEQAQKKD